MPIVTLTSDLGVKDHYVALIKAKLLSGAPGVQIVDISHQVSPFNILEAAFIMRNACFHFPPGTIHLTSVHAESRRPVRAILLEYKGQYFIGMDNGLFSLIMEDSPDMAVEIPFPPDFVSSFITGDILVKIAVDLLKGADPQGIGPAAGALETKQYLRPPDNRDLIRAGIVYIDNFGNVVVNITKERFEKLCGGRSFSIHFKRNDVFSEISGAYQDVPEGEKLCLFNSAGFLEIAIHKGNASQLLGLHLDDIIQITFE